MLLRIIFLGCAHSILIFFQGTFGFSNFIVGLSRIPTDPDWKAAILHLVEWYES